MDEDGIITTVQTNGGAGVSANSYKSRSGIAQIAMTPSRLEFVSQIVKIMLHRGALFDWGLSFLFLLCFGIDPFVRLARTQANEVSRVEVALYECFTCGML